MQVLARSDLQKAFLLPLPGVLAQNAMAPSLRRLPDAIFDRSSKTRRSAVMILLFPSDAGISTLYIKRPEYDGHHSAQVAFPGGKEDDVDDSLQGTAIRECFEEVGVVVRSADIIGSLSPLHIPVSDMDVFPFVAYLQEMPKLRLDDYEVDYAFVVSIDELCSKQVVCSKQSYFKNLPIHIPYYAVSNEEIWGATAMITAELIAVIEGYLDITSSKS